MRILVDTSVWSLALRRDGPADHLAVRKLSSLLESGQDVLLCGVVLQEILQAFRDESTFQRMARMFESFPLVPFGREDFVAAAALRRSCASRGVAASTVDCQIAVAAIRNDCLLLTADQDFHHIAGCSALQLA